MMYMWITLHDLKKNMRAISGSGLHRCIEYQRLDIVKWQMKDRMDFHSTQYLYIWIAVNL